MALIPCKFCGKQVSDKAIACPHCGEKLLAEETVEKTIPCGECGADIPADSTICPSCGCPLEKAEELKIEEAPQKAEITGARMSINMKKPAIIAVAVLAVLAIIAVFVINMVNASKAEANFKENYSSASSTMLAGAILAEEADVLIHDVWYDAIFENYSEADTMKYVKGCNGDFNVALGALISDPDFLKVINSVSDYRKDVAAYMKELTNPPEDFREQYLAIKELYDSFLILTELAVNPTGSLESYTTDFKAADSSFAREYETVKLYAD